MNNKQLNLDNLDKVTNLTYEPLEKKFLKVQFVSTLLIYLCLMVLPLFLILTKDFSYRGIIIIGLECSLIIAAFINLLLIPKAYTYKGFAIREHDISYRSGIIFPSVITIPFCKIQEVSIRQNPVTRLFGLYSIDITNGAQFQAKTSIPGLTKERTNEIKAVIIEYIQNEKN